LKKRLLDGPVKCAFENRCRHLLIADIQQLRQVGPAAKRTAKFAQIRTSIAEVGIIEPPVVWPLAPQEGKYLLLDGRLRIEALKDLGRTEVLCLIATDDEAYTYNRHVSRIATIQEHKMMLTAIERGVSKERIAKALNVDPSSLKEKIRLLEGICPEVGELLKDKHVCLNTFRILRKMRPMRQIEAAESMVAMNCYTGSYAETLLAATPQKDLIDSAKPKKVRGLTAQQMALMERESANLDREYKMIQETHGADLLDLVLVKGYIGKMIANTSIVAYLAQHHADILSELQKLAAADRATDPVKVTT
jgi:RepB plasmid partitioning protein/ParB-like nuclease domain